MHQEGISPINDKIIVLSPFLDLTGLEIAHTVIVLKHGHYFIYNGTKKAWSNEKM